MIKLRVVYLPYERYEDGNVNIGHIKAPTLRSALLEMLNRVNLYLDEESILEIEEEYGRELTADEIIREIQEQNGDGCDTILSILDENTKQEYINSQWIPKFKEWYNYTPDN